MITLFLVRHGLTDWNVEKRYQGHSDIPLNEIGLQQAQKIANRVSSERLNAIISSDLRRTMQTAEIIAQSHKLNLSIQPEPLLREANFGVFEGLTYKDVIQKHQAMAETWFSDPESPPNGGEKLSEIHHRVQGFQDSLIANYQHKKVLIIGHDGSLRLLISHLIGLPATQYWRFNLAPCSLSQINIYEGGAILVRLNDIAHLDF